MARLHTSREPSPKIVVRMGVDNMVRMVSRTATPAVLIKLSKMCRGFKGRTFILNKNVWDLVKYLSPKISIMYLKVIIEMRRRRIMMRMRNKLMTRRADSGRWQPSSSSPSGHWGIKSHLDKCWW